MVTERLFQDFQRLTTQKLPRRAQLAVKQVQVQVLNLEQAENGLWDHVRYLSMEELIFRLLNVVKLIYFFFGSFLALSSRLMNHGSSDEDESSDEIGDAVLRFMDEQNSKIRNGSNFQFKRYCSGLI